MRTPFNPSFGSVIVAARVFGPRGDEFARLVVDTGASFTLIRPDILQRIGCDLAASTSVQHMTTVSGIDNAPSLLVDRIEALGQIRPLLTVVAYAMPSAAAVDGLLGLNFFRGLELCLDFRTGQITLR